MRTNRLVSVWRPTLIPSDDPVYPPTEDWTHPILVAEVPMLVQPVSSERQMEFGAPTILTRLKLYFTWNGLDAKAHRVTIDGSWWFPDGRVEVWDQSLRQRHFKLLVKQETN